MEDLLFSINAILPIFLTLVVGFFLRQIGFLTQEFLDKLNDFAFYVATSTLIFADTSSVNFHETFDGRFISFILLGVTAYALILWMIVPRIEKDRVKCGALIHCGYRSNYALLGVPLAKNLMDAAGVAKAEIALAFTVPLFNILAVSCLAYWSGTKGDYRSILRKIITNPLLIGAFSGLLFSVFQITLPQPVTTSIGYLGNTAMGLGLLLLGASFDVKRFVSDFRTTIFGACLKLLFSPICMVSAALLLGFRGNELMIILILFGAPTAVNSFVMAKAMKSDSELTSGIVICTTGLCVFTLVIGIYLLRATGLF